MMRHATRLLPILLLTLALYARVSGATFCSYDDYTEVHRAAFEDSAEPARMFTTPHFHSFKYRPLNRALNLWSYRAGGGSAWAFRVRNLAYHLLNVALVYLLGWALLGSVRAGTVAAALFALHPLANQTVIGAVMTNTTAHGLLLTGLLCWIRALDEPATPIALPVVGLVCAALSLFFYDSEIVFYPLVVLYAAVSRWGLGRRAFTPRLVTVFLLGSLLSMGLYLALRFRFVPRGFDAAASGHAGLGAIAHNVGLYTAALLGPLDPVLAHVWFRFPFPSELTGRQSSPIPHLVFGIGAIAVGVLIVLGWRHVARQQAPGERGAHGWIALFLIASIALALGPVLLLSGHASETYLYLPLAFLAVLMAGALESLLEGRRGAAIALLAAVLTLFTAATWVRNDRVWASARTADRILGAMPGSLTSGDRLVVLADLPGEPHTVRYGFYGFQGTATIGADDHADEALTCALQLRFRNPSARGQVIPAAAFSDRCAAGARPDEWLAWVHADGRVEPCPSVTPARVSR